MKKIYFDGRPIREPISGVANSIFLMLEALKNSKKFKNYIFLQSNKKRNIHITNRFFKNSIVCDDNRFIKNILFEFGYNTKLLNIKNSILHETYFGRMPASLETNHLVSTIHDVIPIDHPNWFSKVNYYFSKRNFIRQMKNSDLIIFPSKYTSLRAQSIYGSKVNSRIIPWPVFDSIFNLKDTYKPDHKNPFFLMLGNIEPRKNLPFAAKLVFLFNKKFGTNFKLIVAGRSIFKSENIIEQCKKINPNIEFLGYVSTKNKINLLRKTACLLFTSNYEGFGIPLIESLVIGTPFLSNFNSSLAELVPEKRFCYQDNSFEEALINLEKILFKSFKSHLGEFKYNNLCIQYSSHNFKMNLENAYNCLN